MAGARRALILAIVCFVFCFPLVYLLIASFMDASELGFHLAPLFGEREGFIDIPLIPQHPTIESYLRILIDSPGYHALYQNSAIITLSILLGQIFISLPAAWGFAMFDFRGKNALFFVYIVLMMLPFQVMLLPNYLILNSIELIDTYWAVVIPGALSTFPVFIMRHFFQSIPYSLVESARLDGANEFQIFLKIGIPLGKSGIIAVMMLGFFEYWNIVEQPLAFMRNSELWPLSLFIPTIDYAQAGVAFAAAVVAAIPAVLIFLGNMEYLEKGIGAMSRRR